MSNPCQLVAAPAASASAAAAMPRTRQYPRSVEARNASSALTATKLVLASLPSA
jgi:hypothetical protein